MDPSGWPTYELHQWLIGVRRQHAWLTRSRTKVEHLTNAAIALRSGSGDDSVLLLLNVSDEAYDFPVEAGDPLTVAAHSWRLLTERVTPGEVAALSQ